MYHATKAGTVTCTAVLITALTTGGAQADLGDPMLSGQYGWEDGVGTILGDFGPLADPTNVTHPEPVTEGDRALRFTRDDAGVPQAYIVFIENLEDGDVIDASVFLFDDGEEGQWGTGRSRIWGHYSSTGDINAFHGSAGGSGPFTSGIGWEEQSHQWVFDSDGGTRDAFVVHIRGYSQSGSSDDPETAPTNHYVDDVFVQVFCSTNPDLRITFPDGTIIDGPSGSHGPACGPCDQFASVDYGWEDGDGTILGSFGNISFWENIDSTQGPVNSGDRAVRVVQQPLGGPTPQAYLVFVENLQHGDEIFASAFGYDDGQEGSGRMRLWAHYGISGDLDSFAGGTGHGSSFTSGIGWEEISNSWVFDDGGGTRDALMIHMRFDDDGEPMTEYFIDDVFVEVCSHDASNINLVTPEDFILPPPSGDPCQDELDDLKDAFGTPVVEGAYGWEDGEATIFDFFVPFGACFGEPWAGENLSAENITENEGLVHSGDHALKLTENPHCGSTPQAYVAFIEHLEDGDVIYGRFHAFDDTPGEHPRVRIWAHYADSGNPSSFRGSAGGNEQYTTGIGWEPLCHQWTFDSNPDHPDGPRDALMIHVRVFSDPPECLDPEDPDCSTDFFIDDIDVAAWSNNPNVTLTFPDGTVIGDPGVVDECPDFDGGGSVGIVERLTVIGAWGTSDPVADVNEDGIVDGADLGVVLGSWGDCEDFLPSDTGEINLVVEQSSPRIGQTQYQLFVELENEDDTVVNVYDADIDFGGTFDPSESDVTIGTLPPPTQIDLDPNFDTNAFNTGVGIGENAGWFNNNPDIAHGRAGDYPDNQVLIASFVTNDTRSSTAISGSLSVTYTDADGRPIQGTAEFDTDVVDCPADLTGPEGVPDGVVDVFDLLKVIGDWGTCSDPEDCPADLTGPENEPDGIVDVFDLLKVIGEWGSC